MHSHLSPSRRIGRRQSAIHACDSQWDRCYLQGHALRNARHTLNDVEYYVVLASERKITLCHIAQRDPGIGSLKRMARKNVDVIVLEMGLVVVWG